MKPFTIWINPIKFDRVPLHRQATIICRDKNTFHTAPWYAVQWNDAGMWCTGIRKQRVPFEPTIIKVEDYFVT